MNLEAANRCRGWLEEQLENLRGLRNGNPRDVRFKQWRQTTLTVMQRIWSGDSTRSERFRRIRFTSPQSKADGKTVADWFTRGCDEAVSQLTALIAEIDREGVPANALPAAEAAPGDDAFDEEAAFPTLDLSGANAGSGIEIPADRDIVLDLGGPSTAAAAAPSPAAEADTPAPPRLSVSVPPKGSRASRSGAPARSAPPAVRPEEPARPRSSKRSAAKGRLRDLLGLDEVIAKVSEEAPAAPAAGAKEAREPAPAPEAAKHSERATQPTPAPEFTAAAFDDALARMGAKPKGGSAAKRAPSPAKSEEPAVQAAPAVVEPEAAQAASPAFAPEAPSAAAELEPTAAEPVAAPETSAADEAFARMTAEAGPAPAETASDEFPEGELLEGEVEEVTQRFLETSPVLSLTGRPVQRRTDVTRFEHPDAVALATLAEDAARLGVPEDRRDAVRSQLTELAQCVESGDADWHLLAEVVREAMLHRALAQRLMPVLLPWLSRAA